MTKGLLLLNLANHIIRKNRIGLVNQVKSIIKQIVEHKRKSGESPESIFIENGGFIFRKPSWEDAINLLFIRLKNQDTLLENEPIIVAESSEDL